MTGCDVGRQRSKAGAAVSLADIQKTFGSTRAVRDVSVSVGRGEALGIVGHNGAGKTTLMKIMAGLTSPDSGAVSFGEAEMPHGFTVGDAREAGLRLASQEVMLCPDLRVFENVFLGHPGLTRRGRRWRRESKTRLRAHLNELFPGHRIVASATTKRLSLSELQMVQIAIATLPGSSPIRTVVLDEPTSALPEERADDLFRYISKLREETDAAIVIISHKLRDILQVADRILVMRDGAVVRELTGGGLSTEDVVEAMGSIAGAPPARSYDAGDRDAADHDGEVGRTPQAAEGAPVRVSGPGFEMRAGEIVGLAGLEGQGQADVLRAAWKASNHKAWGRVSKRRPWSVAGGTRTTYVSGDRQQFGVFPLWDVRRNMSLAALGRLTRLGLISTKQEKILVDRWVREMEILGGASQSIVELSGGNQQKVLLARGLAAEPDVILLDDPFRGVDVMTKRSSYRWLRQAAQQGCCVLWYSSESDEMRQCSRVYVLSDGDVAGELSGADVSEEMIIKHSFGRTRLNERVVQG
ncbi:MAG TPA: sugar ABC transporter ATP-binding protein [Candidatus Acidoferrales bacterium]|nr:sugar ABC transporter ATP-binding protein [Candidatus Acidoferrales bacterium]